MDEDDDVEEDFGGIHTEESESATDLSKGDEESKDEVIKQYLQRKQQENRVTVGVVSAPLFARLTWEFAVLHFADRMSSDPQGLVTAVGLLFVTWRVELSRLTPDLFECSQ